MSTQYYYHEAIGQVNITRRKGSRRISLRVKPDGTVLVNHPWFAGNKEVVNFILDHVDWIKAQQQKIKDRKIVFSPGDTIPTTFHSITIVSVPKGKLQGVMNRDKVVITIPPSEEITSERVQKLILKVITEVCRHEAKQYLPGRVRELAMKHGFQMQNVFVKNLRSKWGSCSTAGNINLNLHLMRLPAHLIDYIILHELAHTREMNHGTRFRQLLEQLTDGKSKHLEQEMKAKGKTLLQQC